MQDNIQITVNGYNIDITDDFRQTIQVTFSIFDVRDPGNFKNEFSKSCTLPLTPTNRQAFNYPDKTHNAIVPVSTAQLGQSPVKKNYPAVILVNGITFFAGTACIWTAFTDQDKPDAIEVFFSGGLQSWYNYINQDSSSPTYLQPLYLKDLPFTSHTYDQTTVKNSFFGAGLDYIYPVIGYGVWRFNNNSRATSGSFATTPPQESKYGINGVFTGIVAGQGTIMSAGTEDSQPPAAYITGQPGDLRPAVYWWKVLQYYFKATGYVLKSKFFASEFFTQMILPFVGKFQIGDTAAKAYQVRVANNADQTFTGGLSPTPVKVAFQDNSTLPDYDGGLPSSALWDTSGYTFTASRGGFYTFNFFFQTSCVVTPGTSPIFNVQFLIYKNGSFIHSLTSYLASVSGNNQVSTMDPWFFQNMYLAVGDTLSVYCTMTLVSGTGTGSVTLKSGSYFEILIDRTLKYGDTIDFAYILDDQTPVVNLILDIFRLFNIYTATDYQRKIVYAEPYSVPLGVQTDQGSGWYYPTEQAEDWTEKIDISVPIQKDFLLQLYSQLQLFTYANDSKDAVVASLGNTTSKVPNPFQSKLIQMSEGFIPNQVDTIGPSKIAATSAYLDGLEQPENYPIPQMWSQITSGASLPPYSNDFAFRILYIDPSNYFSISIDGVITSAPCVYSIDPTANKKYNLAFEDYDGIPGLYSNYWANYMSAINEGYLLTASVHITRRDIAALLDDGNQLQLWRKPIWIKDGYFTIKQIVDYDPFKETAKVEFLSYYPPKEPVITTFIPDTHRTGGSGSDIQIINNNGVIIVLSDGSTNGGAASSQLVTGRSVVANNGSGASAQRGQAQVNLSYGGSTFYYGQIALGQFPDLSDPNVVFAIGNGSPGSPANLLTVNTDGSISTSGGGPGSARSGQAALLSGTKTIPFSGVTSTSVILVTPTETGTLTGTLSVNATSGSFTVSSTVPTDTVAFNWYIAKI